MELIDFFTGIIGVLLAIVGFILKQLWTDIRSNKESQGKLKGKIELVDQKFEAGLNNLQHVNNLKFLQLSEKLDIMCNDIKKDICKLSDTLDLMSKNVERDNTTGKFKRRT